MTMQIPWQPKPGKEEERHLNYSSRKAIDVSLIQKFGNEFLLAYKTYDKSPWRGSKNLYKQHHLIT